VNAYKFLMLAVALFVIACGPEESQAQEYLYQISNPTEGSNVSVSKGCFIDTFTTSNGPTWCHFYVENVDTGQIVDYAPFTITNGYASGSLSCPSLDGQSQARGRVWCTWYSGPLDAPYFWDTVYIDVTLVP
jgi:hypothetical protein